MICLLKTHVYRIWKNYDKCVLGNFLSRFLTPDCIMYNTYLSHEYIAIIYMYTTVIYPLIFQVNIIFVSTCARVINLS